MTLTAGQVLGPYEIIEKAGAGGMGEIYKANDPRLDRTVAIKILHSSRSVSPELRERFEREAKAISSLNHAHICTLHDIGSENGIDYLVMEFLEGETLADRLTRRMIPYEEMLQISIEIASGLDAAHHQGLIHRDLKPGNIMLTSEGAKLLDFGLAKLQLNQTDEEISAVTQTTPLTGANTILGTMQYMAPEQLEGKEADVRSDIFSFGAIMYEMATGKRAFEGSSNATLIASIIGQEPISISAVIPTTPPLFERLVKKCLSKEPRKRWQSVADLSDELRWISQGGSQVGLPAQVAARRKFKFDLARAIGAVAILSTATLAYLLYAEKTNSGPEAIQTLIGSPTDVFISNRSAEMALSPDGRTVAFQANDELWIRPLGSAEATRLPGTEGAFRPFWSPDSRTIAFFADGKLMRVPVSGGSPTSICEAISGRGGAWSDDDFILLSPNLSSPLMQVSASGGEPTAVTTVDSAKNQTGHRFPSFLPDGNHFLFATLPAVPDGWDTYVGSLKSGAIKRLLTARSVAIYAEPGYLLFERDGRVLAQRFDTDRLELVGAPVAFADAPEPSDLDAEPVASASLNGRLAILQSEPADTRLEMRDKNGVTTVNYELPPGHWEVSRVTLDGQRASLLKGDELWALDLARSVPMLLATDLASTPMTAWSPNGSRIAFGKRHETREEIYISDLGGNAELVPTTPDPFKGVRDWSQDGRYLLFWSQNAETSVDVWILPMEGERKPVPYLRSKADETGAMLSPDGRWVAYTSNETGNPEIYVQSFPEPGNKTRISIDGGVGPAWTEGGRRLIYFNLTNQELVGVPVREGDDFEPGQPSKYRDFFPDVTSGALLEDGRVLVSVAHNLRPRDIRIIQDWTALLEQ